MARVVFDLDYKDLLKLVEDSSDENDGKAILQIRQQIAESFVNEHIKGKFKEDAREAVAKIYRELTPELVGVSPNLTQFNISPKAKAEIASFIQEELKTHVRTQITEGRKRLDQQISNQLEAYGIAIKERIDKRLTDEINTLVNTVVTQRLQAALDNAASAIPVQLPEEKKQSNRPIEF